MKTKAPFDTHAWVYQKQDELAQAARASAKDTTDDISHVSPMLMKLYEIQGELRDHRLDGISNKAIEKLQMFYQVLGGAEQKALAASPDDEKVQLLSSFAEGLISFARQVELADHAKAKGVAPERLEEWEQKSVDALKEAIGYAQSGSEVGAIQANTVITNAVRQLAIAHNLTTEQEKDALSDMIVRGVKAILENVKANNESSWTKEHPEATRSDVKDLTALVNGLIMNITLGTFGQGQNPAFVLGTTAGWQFGGEGVLERK